MFSLQLVLVDTKHDGGVEVVTAGMGEQHFFRASIQMRFAMFTVTVHAGTVQHHIHTQFAPGQLFNTVLMQHADGIVTDEQLFPFLANVPGKATVAGVIFQQMRHARSIRQFIDCHHGDFRTTPGFI